MRSLGLLDWIAFFLVALGGINWGAYGLFKIDVVAAFFGGPERTLARVVYVLIGAAGLYIVYYVARENP